MEKTRPSSGTPFFFFQSAKSLGGTLHSSLVKPLLKVVVVLSFGSLLVRVDDDGRLLRFGGLGGGCAAAAAAAAVLVVRSEG